MLKEAQISRQQAEIGDLKRKLATSEAQGEIQSTLEVLRKDQEIERLNLKISNLDSQLQKQTQETAPFPPSDIDDYLLKAQNLAQENALLKAKLRKNETIMQSVKALKSSLQNLEKKALRKSQIQEREFSAQLEEALQQKNQLSLQLSSSN